MANLGLIGRSADGQNVLAQPICSTASWSDPRCRDSPLMTTDFPMFTADFSDRRGLRAEGSECGSAAEGRYCEGAPALGPPR